MKTTRLSEKLNNKRGASILVALVLFLVVSMTAVLVLAATTANSGRMAKQRAQEGGVEYANSLIQVIKYQIKNTDMRVEYQLSEDAYKVKDDELIENPLEYVDGNKTVTKMETGTLFCADYINTASDKMLAGETMGSYTYDITPVGDTEAVKSAYKDLTAQAIIEGMDFTKKNFTIKGSIQVKANDKVVTTVKFKIPASVSVQKDRKVDWTNAAKTVTKSGTVIVKWGNLITY